MEEAGAGLSSNGGEAGAALPRWGLARLLPCNALGMDGSRDRRSAASTRWNFHPLKSTYVGSIMFGIKKKIPTVTSSLRGEAQEVLTAYTTDGSLPLVSCSQNLFPVVSLAKQQREREKQMSETVVMLTQVCSFLQGCCWVEVTENTALPSVSVQIAHAIGCGIFNVDVKVSSQGIPVLGHMIVPSRGGGDGFKGR